MCATYFSPISSIKKVLSIMEAAFSTIHLGWHSGTHARIGVSYIVDDRSTGEVIYSPIRKVLLMMMEAAFSAINLELHSGAHPRMGVNDDLSFHPLGQATMEDAAYLAKQVASDIGNDFQGMLNF